MQPLGAGHFPHSHDLRYQLTPIGRFAQFDIAAEIAGNQFSIAGGRAGMKVSWQVTGVRRDAYAKAHPLVVESNKQREEHCHYVHPDAFGQPLEMGHHRRGARQVARATWHETGRRFREPERARCHEVAGRKISNSGMKWI